MLSEAALLLVQFSMADCPGPILAGLAVSATLRIFTAAEACAVTPPAPVAVAMYVVAAVGTMVTEPERATVVWSSPRMEGLMESEVALVLVQARVAVCPAATTGGEMLMVTVG